MCQRPVSSLQRALIGCKATDVYATLKEARDLLQYYWSPRPVKREGPWGTITDTLKRVSSMKRVRGTWYAAKLFIDLEFDQPYLLDEWEKAPYRTSNEVLELLTNAMKSVERCLPEAALLK